MDANPAYEANGSWSPLGCLIAQSRSFKQKYKPQNLYETQLWSSGIAESVLQIFDIVRALLSTAMTF